MAEKKTTTAVTKSTGTKVDRPTSASMLRDYPQIQAVQRAIALVDYVFEQMEGPEVVDSKPKPGTGVDYGLVPGIKKPFLFKAGAERLALYFEFRVGDYEVEDCSDPDKDYFYFKVKGKVFAKDGGYLGMGMGSCSSRESKYAYRWIRYNELPSAFKTTGDIKTDFQAYIDANGAGSAKWQSFGTGGQYVFRVKNDLVSDLCNTVLKMAKKRCYIDAIQTVTGADRKFMRSEELEKPFEPPTEPEETGEIPGSTPEPPAPQKEPKPTTDTSVDVAFQQFKEENDAWLKKMGWAPTTYSSWLQSNFKVGRIEDLPPEKWAECNHKLADLVAMK